MHTLSGVQSDHCLCQQSSAGREVDSAGTVGSDLLERKALLELFSGEQLDEVLQPPHTLPPPPPPKKCVVISVSLKPSFY